jgi:hypothetical protein
MGVAPGTRFAPLVCSESLWKDLVLAPAEHSARMLDGTRDGQIRIAIAIGAAAPLTAGANADRKS